jgi:hypothetical protein
VLLPATTPTASDAIERPDPGLALGRWEAPAWMFWVVAVVALLGGIAWIAIALRARYGTPSTAPERGRKPRGTR